VTVPVEVSRKQWLPAAVQKRPPALLVQQTWFLPPQVPQLPLAAQFPPVVLPHPVPGDTQTDTPLLSRPQQPVLQRLPAQQGAPLSPHFRQVLLDDPPPPAQTVPGSVHWGDDEQQPIPCLPQTH
jgi:hypothetical protein